MEQHGFDFALTERVPSRNLADRIEEPVSAKENISGIGLFAPKELAKNHAKLKFIDVGFQRLIGHIIKHCVIWSFDSSVERRLHICIIA